MKLKQIIRVSALTFMIVLASVLPVPLTFYAKDNLPKHLIEMVDKKNEEDEEEEVKALF
jgi:hypothetical protein